MEDYAGNSAASSYSTDLPARNMSKLTGNIKPDYSMDSFYSCESESGADRANEKSGPLEVRPGSGSDGLTAVNPVQTAEVDLLELDERPSKNVRFAPEVLTSAGIKCILPFRC